MPFGTRLSKGVKRDKCGIQVIVAASNICSSYLCYALCNRQDITVPVPKLICSSVLSFAST